MNVVSNGPTLDFGANFPITVTVSSGVPTIVRTEMQYGMGTNNEGLYHLQTPNCTQCCAGMMNLVSVRLWNVTGTPQFNPTFTVSAATRSVTLNFTTTADVKVGQLVQVALADAQWPQCLLYNGANLPVLPLRVNVEVTAESSVYSTE